MKRREESKQAKQDVQILELRKSSRVIEGWKGQNCGTLKGWQEQGEFNRRLGWQGSQGQCSQGLLGHIKDCGFYPKCNEKAKEGIYTEVI